VIVLGRESKTDNLFDAEFSTFEEDEVYDQKDAGGFIKLNALRLIIAGRARKNKKGK
jgi:argininosuccinate synthase